jgi:hypothetical protein
MDVVVKRKISLHCACQELSPGCPAPMLFTILNELDLRNNQANSDLN